MLNMKIGVLEIFEGDEIGKHVDNCYGIFVGVGVDQGAQKVKLEND